MHKCVVVIIFSFLISSCAYFTKSKDEQVAYKIEDLKIRLNVEKFVLGNGLRVLLVEDHRLPIASYYTFYDVGGRYEREGVTGATHFLEHLMFKGAKRYGPGEFDKIISGNGGRNNAYTSFDSTVYYQSFPSKIIENIIDLESDRMENLKFEEAAFEKERAVVLEERKTRYENNPRGKLYLKMMQSFFKGTPYGLSVIGEAEDVQGLSRATMKDFFHRFYKPNNAVVVVVGDINTKKTRKLIKKYYGGIPRSANLDAFKKKMDAPKRFVNKPSYKNVHLVGDTGAPLFMIAYQGEPGGTRRAYILDYLASIIGSGQSSYLFQRLVKGKRPIVNDISVSNYNLRNNGIFFVSGQLLRKKKRYTFAKTFKKTVRKACNQAITQRNILKTKNRLLVSYYNALETNAGIASLLGESEHFFGDYSYYQKELEIYNSITLDEVKRACHEMFDKSRSMYLTIGKSKR